ncbi:MAG: ankyrin repeat domain-containing protein [Capsulimonas sp.]|uniref:ankyrin repeat domain-containing protein n=1 Tax=Capsulimonas sp. TaxID=2494211 RepID=UPI003265CE09
MQPPSYSSPTPVKGTLILALGILSIGLPILGPVAWIMGNKSLSLIDSGFGDPMQRQNTKIGRICGMVGTVILILVILGYAAMAMLNFGIARPKINAKPGQAASKAMQKSWSKKAHSRTGILIAEARDLQEAISKNDAAKIQSIVHQDRAVLSVRNPQGETPIFQTVGEGKPAMTSLLLRLGASVNAKNSAGATPVDKAREVGKDDVLAVLVGHGGRSGKG